MNIYSVNKKSNDSNENIRAIRTWESSNISSNELKLYMFRTNSFILV